MFSRHSSTFGGLVQQSFELHLVNTTSNDLHSHLLKCTKLVKNKKPLADKLIGDLFFSSITTMQNNDVIISNTAKVYHIFSVWS